MIARLLAAGAALALAAGSAAAQTAPQDHGQMDHGAMDHSAMEDADAQDAKDEGATDPGAVDHGAMDHDDPDAAPSEDHAGHQMTTTGALGPYATNREASGTAWQPDVSPHHGLHGQAGGWSLMGHALLNGVYDSQSGRRGDDMGFLSGMLMGSARKDLAGGDAVQLRIMLSPDPLMGAEGYPLLLAAGESADGRTTLVDRQHPHDAFMELSASYSRRLAPDASAFLYLGWPGEPAFGPPSFMHRLSAMDSPEAPISHHWLDSTHIVFGVATAGATWRGWKLEGSSFTGREPDEDRWDFERPKLDSTAARLSWNPTPQLSLQASWADLHSPEALEPDLDETRWSASAIYTRLIGDGWWSTTLAWGRKERSDGVELDAVNLETALKPNPAWTLFARAERVETDELDAHGGHAHGEAATVGKVTVGVVRDFAVKANVSLGLGGLYSVSFIPESLEHAYGDHPTGTMVFVRLKIGG